jgi:hypothetical protein
MIVHVEWLQQYRKKFIVEADSFLEAQQKVHDMEFEEIDDAIETKDGPYIIFNEHVVKDGFK